ncbi:hypothetical protein PF005_g7055 [Phytophthora fragariae]|uniref:Uncharacterized protein n=2 Tax=Phytophthora TaxID=4783 RepID=A0A6A3LJ31_9STRA|nr:hypothetical protein PF003_g9023 [Phytophthora fragariae]KAE9019042.1 hypothetical protein PR002_g12924 [Phytophthora rubi]KAE8942257.1 hypothetical protein PF009_g7970 [Phytophthora fragariae]KAE9019169.1 hypothetical protein PF011_g5942 [Phytophthora fragariae]KAE9048987.1 hypothetical protein PR001_g3614 [Phytophthora rubi]
MNLTGSWMISLTHLLMFGVGKTHSCGDSFVGPSLPVEGRFASTLNLSLCRALQN